MAGFTHAHDHDFTAASGDSFTCPGKICIDVPIELGQAITLNLKHFFAGLLKVKARLQLDR
ncbi:Uncharacterised protein [Serratia fonticola]|uniref:Uncharacterized protein n=1 Tax=Serratia fonticola TaxID=47917 RepID=A0A4U9W8Y7_SERFO|nr:Uncharacterised protein [Serratia fonticola]